MAPKGFEERLKAAADGAAEGAAVNLDRGDAGRPLDLAGRWRAHEDHLDPLDRNFIRHPFEATPRSRHAESAESRIGYLARSVVTSVDHGQDRAPDRQPACRGDELRRPSP